MIKRTAATTAAALALALGGTGAALAANGADDPAGHQHHHHHGKGHHHHGKAEDHGGKGNEPGDDHGGGAAARARLSQGDLQRGPAPRVIEPAALLGLAPPPMIPRPIRIGP